MTSTCSPSWFLQLAFTDGYHQSVAVGKYAKASGGHYNRLVVVIIAARAASAHGATNGTDASASYSLIGLLSRLNFVDSAEG